MRHIEVQQAAAQQEEFSVRAEPTPVPGMEGIPGDAETALHRFSSEGATTLPATDPNLRQDTANRFSGSLVKNTLAVVGAVGVLAAMGVATKNENSDTVNYQNAVNQRANDK